MDRATPSAALNSSTHPYASTRGAAFDNRRPYISDVSPLSPVLVTMDTRPNCKAFDSLAPARSLVRASVYVTRLPPAPFCETPIHEPASDPGVPTNYRANRSQVAVRLLPSLARQPVRLFPPA